MTTEIKRMTAKEFRKQGFLLELNRQFLHPLGLAMECIIDEETKEETFGEIWDYRDDPEGMFFGKNMITMKDKKELSNKINKLRQSKLKVRRKTGLCDKKGVQIK